MVAKRLLLAGAGVAAALCALTPVPGALIVRSVFNRDSSKTRRRLDEGAPHVDVRSFVYDDRLMLDVYRPLDMDGSLPVIIWTHGGAWLSGSRREYAGYFRRLAVAGFCVVAPDYGPAPRHRYPAVLHHMNSAHRFLLDHADEIGGDMSRMVLAGDSAGAQLSAQMVLAVIDERYRADIGVIPVLQAESVRGVILNCGIYDLAAVETSAGIVGWGVRQALWAYTGAKSFASSKAANQISVLHRVGAGFPRAWISGGNADPLTADHSKLLAGKLEKAGCSVETLFFADDLAPGLGHEYQCQLDRSEAREALWSLIGFAREVTER